MCPDSFSCFLAGLVRDGLASLCFPFLEPTSTCQHNTVGMAGDYHHYAIFQNSTFAIPRRSRDGTMLLGHDWTFSSKRRHSPFMTQHQSIANDLEKVFLFRQNLDDAERRSTSCPDQSIKANSCISKIRSVRKARSIRHSR